MSNADIYIQKYKQLESLVRETFELKTNDSIRFFLNNKEEFKYCREEIGYCQDVRNLLQHREKISGEYPIEPTEEMIIYLDKVIEKVQNRKRCIDICIPYDKVYKCKMSNPVKPVMRTMKKKGYTYVPVYLEGKMVGVFSDSSLTEYMLTQDWRMVDEKMTFYDLKEYISLDKHEHEHFRFVSEHFYVDELKRQMEQDMKRSKRTVMIFVTKHGGKNDRFLGIITPWMII